MSQCFDHSQQGDSQPETNNWTCDGWDSPFCQDKGNGKGKSERERLPLYCNRSTYTTSASFIGSFNLSFVLRETKAINKRVGHPLHNPQI